MALLELLSNDGLLIEYVKRQTEELCLVAVKQNGLALQFIHDPSISVCLAAIIQNQESHKYIPENIIKRAFALKNE